jgi:hypothetical protein
MQLPTTTMYIAGLKISINLHCATMREVHGYQNLALNDAAC